MIEMWYVRTLVKPSLQTTVDDLLKPLNTKSVILKLYNEIWFDNPESNTHISMNYNQRGPLLKEKRMSLKLGSHVRKNRGRRRNRAQTGRTESNPKTPALILVDK